MWHTKRFRHCLGPAFAALIAFAPAHAAERGFADPLLGRWDLTVHHPDGDYPSWLEVRLRTEGEITGRFVGRFGSVRHLPSVGYSDGVVEFTAPAQYESHDLHFTGRLDDGRLSGHSFDAEGRVVRFSGRRAPLLRREREARPGTAIELFDGRTLDGWRFRDDRHPGCWRVDEGLMSATPPCVDLVTEDQFGDFRLEVEFRYPEGSNSGIYLRGRYEVQIQDDQGRAIDPLRIGGVYGFVAPAVDAARPAGDWQTYGITLVGRTVTVVLNDVTIIDGQDIPGITGGALDSDEASPGPIMLQGDHGPIEFRRVTLTPLR